MYSTTLEGGCKRLVGGTSCGLGAGPLLAGWVRGTWDGLNSRRILLRHAGTRSNVLYEVEVGASTAN